MVSNQAHEAVKRLAQRSTVPTETDLQSDIHLLLVSGALGLEDDQVVKLESQLGDGTRRRIDIEVGHLVIEVKKDLRKTGILVDAEKQLAGYLERREAELSTTFAGILTDGTSWILYRLDDGVAIQVAQLDLDPREPDSARLVSWLESILATRQKTAPTPSAITEMLGAEAPGHRLDHAALADLLDEQRTNPEVQLKRSLWAKLLRTAYGDAFSDDEQLFVNHTLLVITAEAIGHAVIGFDIANDLSPADIITGSRFDESQVHGVVESDFFDWPLVSETGAQVVADIIRRVARFDWSAVDHDVMKHLYESVIEQRDRQSLGEYYTPDWLAHEIVADTITDPATQRVLDPSCGSGTFLFHAVRAHVQAVEGAGSNPGQAVSSACAHVFGIDIHPVAVTLARVTYLMALGTARLAHEQRGPVTVPVFLGDSLQWERHRDLFADSEAVRVSTSSDELMDGGGGGLFDDVLVFPASVWSDAGKFDSLVGALAAEAIRTAARANKSTPTPTISSLAPILKRHGITEEDDRKTLATTFETWLGLERQGRDRIWGYYVRNLVRPIWLSQPDHRVDVLVGNPPWLRYSKMTPAMQTRYIDLAKPRQLLTGGLGASARDLSTLFVARAVELYLTDGGKFSFVMPFGTLSRRPHTGFRTGKWSNKDANLSVAFDEPWDLSNIQPLFPMTSCVVRGRHSSAKSTALPETAVQWQGPKLKQPAHPVGEVDIAAIDADDAAVYPYQSDFRDGAILYPRMLLFISEKNAGPLGAGGGRISVSSFRSPQEKGFWKDAPSLEGTVEQRFLRGVHLGDTVVPFRALDPRRAVLPLDDTHLFTQKEIDQYPALSVWWEKVESVWESGRAATEKAPLHERLDFHRQLSAQLPIRPNRVVYTKSGSNLVAARIPLDDLSVIDHKLYWASFDTEAEALYLVGLLNADVLKTRVTRYQAKGLLGARDFDKYVFRAGLVPFDDTDPNHLALVEVAREAEQTASQVVLGADVANSVARKLVVSALLKAGVTGRLEKAASVCLA